MWGFDRKRFLITLGLSILVWVVTVSIEFFVGNERVSYGMFIFAKSCDLTGYPFAKCIPSYNFGKLYLFYFLNISFWFLVVNVVWGWFQKIKQKSG